MSKVTCMNKTCARCKQDFPVTEFRFFPKGKYRSSYCRECERAYQRDWGKTEKGIAYRRAKYKRNYARSPALQKAKSRASYVRRWAEILAIYGQLCVCCGETESCFLTVDHVLNNGAQDRRERGGNTVLRTWLARNPKSPDYQILCWNCQWGKRITGVCPHQATKLGVNISA